MLCLPSLNGFIVGRLAAIVVAATVLGASSATALTLQVNDSRDLPDVEINGVCEVELGTGLCTLRAALSEVNATGTSGHLVLIGQRTIELEPMLGTFMISPGVGVTLWGTGSSQSIIDGLNRRGLFRVSENATLVVFGLSLINGRAGDGGGAIDNAGLVYVIETRLYGNTASAGVLPQGTGGAILNRPTGQLLSIASTFKQNQSRGSGAGIRNEGWLSVVNSTFAGNNAAVGSGGALANFGTASILTSTFSENRSTDGGAILNTESGRLVIFSSTFANNFVHTLNLSNTFTNYPGGLVSLANTLVFAPTSTVFSPTSTNSTGAIQSLGFNLSNDETCGFTGNGDRQNVDPMLGPLMNNGGPTETHALLPTSPAIDQGRCFGLDQRGRFRPVNLPAYPNAANGCDIGAYELQRSEAR